jgi:hypothetical protein
MFKKVLILTIIFSTLILPVYAAKDVETKLAERNVIESLTTQPLNIDDKKKPSKKEVPKKEPPKQEIPKKVENDPFEPVGIWTSKGTLPYTDENINAFKNLLSTFYSRGSLDGTYNPARNEAIKSFVKSYGLSITSSASFLDYNYTFTVVTQSIPKAI